MIIQGKHEERADRLAHIHIQHLGGKHFTREEEESDNEKN